MCEIIEIFPEFIWSVLYFSLPLPQLSTSKDEIESFFVSGKFLSYDRCVPRGVAWRSGRICGGGSERSALSLWTSAASVVPVAAPGATGAATGTTGRT